MPRKKKSTEKTVVISICFPKSILARIDKAAKSDGRNRSNYITHKMDMLTSLLESEASNG